MIPVFGEPVAHDLFVERVFALAALPRRLCPEAAGVRGQNFVGEGGDTGGRVGAEFKLCVGQNQPGLFGQLGSSVEDLER